MRLDAVLTLLAFPAVFFLSRVFGNSLKHRGVMVSGGVPCCGGLSIGIPFLGVSAFVYARQGLWGPVPGVFFALASVVLLFGVLDDLRELGVPVKFVFQALVAACLIGIGVRTRIALLPEAGNIAVSFLWLLWTFNAFNLLDIMDGLAVGVSLIVSVGFWIASLGEPGGAWAPILAVCLAAFLFFNAPPARRYLGNSGSYFLGFVFAAGSLGVHYATGDDVVALATPLLILGLPLFDTIFLVVMRLRRHKMPFLKSKDHIALRFLSVGHSKKKVLVLLWALCVFYVAAGLWIGRLGNAAGAVVLGCVIGTSVHIAVRAARATVHD